MKKLYILLFFVFSFLANAQIVNIPDANFKALLLNMNSSNSGASTNTPVYNATSGNWVVSNYHAIDTNGDGEIQMIEAQAIKYLKITGYIFDLTGIEAFINLEYVECNATQLSSLGFTQNVNLVGLYCYQNTQLTSLDVSQNVNLQTLRCNNNKISSLDVTGAVNLQKLEINHNYQLTNLDVTGAVNLQQIVCYYNTQLTSLDVSQNVNLQLLTCNNNQLTSLDVTGAVNLVYLNCKNNQISSLDVTGAMNLQSLDCSNNQLTILEIKNNNGNWNTLIFNSNPNLHYICADDEDLSLVQQRINSYGYSSTCHVNSYCSFTPNGTFYEISGNTKFDSNNNGCDANDINYPNLKFNITDGTNSGSFIANTSGSFYIPVSAGSHTVTPVLENPTYFNISPLSFTVDFPIQVSPIVQDFCISFIPHSDVEIMVMPTTPARPGFDAHYRIIYKNIGNQVENGEVTFAYGEDVLDLISSSITIDSQNTIANTTTLSWNYSSLLPFETRTTDVILNVNSPTETPAVNNGDVLGIFSEISTTNSDEDLSNNSSSLRQVVVGSYDPNDKTCVEGKTVDVSMVGEYVHYVIRFENTGTYPAENIVVKDIIDTSKFEVSTLIPLHGSHEFFTRINGNKVEFIFENINLDFNDATNDGYVAFKIKTKNNLTLGQTFSNNASIYFDYNFPIVTNTYTTTINNVLNNQDFNIENEFLLYPNPAKDILNISTKNQTEIQSIEIYNLIGQVVIAIPNSTNKIDVSSLEAGTYFMKVNSKKGSSTTKFVKE